MGFSDPQSVTINAVAQSLPRTQPGVMNSLYEKNDGLVALRISHTNSGRRERHSVRLDHKKVAADPLVAGINVEVGTSVGFWVDNPRTNFYTETEIKQIAESLATWLTASSSANLIKLLGGEH